MIRKKVFFIVPTLGAGGAEKVLSFLAEGIDNSLFDCQLVVIGSEADSLYPIDKSRVVYLNKNRVLLGIFALARVFILQKPDIVFGSIRHVNLLLGIMSLVFRKICFVAREASVMSSMKYYDNSKLKVPNFVVEFLYRRFQVIVCQSKDIKDDLMRSLKLDEKQLKIIGNPITISHHGNKRPKDLRCGINLITVGRLSEEKGYFRILKCLSLARGLNFTYTIIGDGKQYEDLRNYVEDLGLLDQVEFIRKTTAVSHYLLKADFYIQGSYVEGFPNALLECISLGIPAIVYDCPGGTKDIIIDEFNGFIVKNDDDFLGILQNTTKLMTINNQNVAKSVKDKFAALKILKIYEETLMNL